LGNLFCFMDRKCIQNIIDVKNADANSKEETFKNTKGNSIAKKIISNYFEIFAHLATNQLSDDPLLPSAKFGTPNTSYVILATSRSLGQNSTRTRGSLTVKSTTRNTLDSRVPSAIDPWFIMRAIFSIKSIIWNTFVALDAMRDSRREMLLSGKESQCVPNVTRNFRMRFARELIRREQQRRRLQVNVPKKRREQLKNLNDHKYFELILKFNIVPY